MINLYVHNYLSISDVIPTENSIVISINDPSQDMPKLSKRFIDILEIKINDIDDPNYAKQFGYTILDESQSDNIISFVNKHILNGVTEVYVHCMAGISRSSGTAAALSKIYNGDDSIYFNHPTYRPNNHVRSLILNSAVKLGIWDPK